MAELATQLTGALDRGEIEAWFQPQLDLHGGGIVGAEAWRAAGDDIAAALKDDALPVGATAGLPLHRFPLEQTDAAHDAVENTLVGKALIDVA